MRRIPVIATTLVLAAVATMIALGFWQLRRLHWKEALLARYESAATDGAPVAYPTADPTAALYRRSAVTCTATGATEVIAGRSAAGQPGWAHLATCTLPGAAKALIALGWSPDPAARSWSGGSVTGILAPAGENGARLVADPPLAGLAALAKPDPRDIPNNHLAYAVQWFLFAAVALIIYVLALRRRFKP